MAATAISSVLQVLNPLIQKEVSLLRGVKNEMKKLSSTLSTILAVLDDAELKQFQQRAIKDWLRKLKDTAYEVRDILEDCKAEASRWEQEGQSRSTLRKVRNFYPVKNLLFRHDIGNRMKDAMESLDAIAKEKNNFHLNERICENLIDLDERRETGSIPSRLQVFAREADKNHVVKVLTLDVCDIQEVSVYPIIGMGGLGKTTLAQMILNDQKIKSHFEPVIWVYVSPDFNPKRVMKLIIESVSKKTCEESSLDSLQKQVCEMLSKKRFLLVLDDVWNEDRQEWEKLMSALSTRSTGACILATTRSEKVASIIRTLPTYPLSVLSPDDCWLVFRQHAFGPDNEECPELVAIGKEIVKKCGGVPLAAKALGGLMRSKIGEKEWVNIKESNLWDLPQGEVPILPALRLSYYNLPLELRHCFSYIAVYPKGSRIGKEKVIQLWMANGFISSRGNLEVENVGKEVLNELYNRSLFLNDANNPEEMFLHDLVHDLARSFIEEECYTMEAESSSIISKQNIRHATLISNGKLASAFPDALKGQKKLHSILLQDRGQYTYPESIREFSCDFKNFGSLRLLDVSGAKVLQLSDSIGSSKHLTYLDLSKTPITELPASICSLPNLQTLNLNCCRELERLPEKMHCLRSLRHLSLLERNKIVDTPPKLGKLTQLKTLSLFVVGESDGRRLGELQHLDLGGELSIRHLERVRNSTEAKEANLGSKHNLRVLTIEWGDEQQGNIVEQEVFEALKPHPNVRELAIINYRVEEFPVWMSDPSVLKNVVSIKIINRNSLRLPALWRLPCLKCLEVIGMDRMEYMFQNGNGNFGGGARAFLSLEELKIWQIPNLKGLSMEEEEGTGHQRMQLFPRLRKMEIWFCPQLALPVLPALEELEINHSSSITLLASISKLPTLTSLRLYEDEKMAFIPNEMLQNLTLLQQLNIHAFRALKVLPESLSRLVALRKLRISKCKKLECLTDGGIRGLKSLLQIDIERCPQIVSLPDSIRKLTQLQHLGLWNFPSEFKRRYKEGKGEDWYKIAHIPKVTIW